MKKCEMIKSHEEFSKMINNSKYVKNSYFTIYYEKKIGDFTRYGIAISKKFGKANIRNYYKRITRNIIDLNKKTFKNTHDYIIMIKGACVDKKYKDLSKEFENLLKEIKYEKEN